jgi:hypothetical protein
VIALVPKGTGTRLPVDHKRMYFHAGCEPPIAGKPDLAEDKISSVGKAQ